MRTHLNPDQTKAGEIARWHDNCVAAASCHDRDAVPECLEFFATLTGVATASTAGNATAVPTIVTSANSAYRAAVMQAMVFVEAFTAIFVPHTAAWWPTRVRRYDAAAANVPERS